MAGSQFAQADVNFPAAAAGVAGAAVNLGNQLATVRQHHQRLRANRRAAVQINSRMSGPFAQRRAGLGRQRQQQMQSEKRAGVRRNVVVKVRRLPLIGEQEVQPPVAVHVGERDASADHRLGKADFGADVVVTPVGGAHEERIQVSARSNPRPA